MRRIKGILGQRGTIRGVVILLLVMPILSFTARAQMGLLTTDPTDTTVELGETFNLDVVVDENMVGLKGYDIKITFNPSVLSLETVTEGPLLPSGGTTFFAWQTLGPDTVQTTAAVLEHLVHVDGPGVLFTVRFQSIAYGSSPIHFALDVLRDSLNLPLPHNTADGSVTVSDITVPSVGVIFPNGGEVLTPGVDVTITWNQSDNVGVVSDSIYYSINGGTSWIPVWGGGATMSYGWTVPGTPSANCRVKVVAFDAGTNRGEDISDGDFTISQVGVLAIDPADTTVEIGEAFDLDITVDANILLLQGYEVKIAFDPDTVSVDTVTQGALLPSGGPTLFNWQLLGTDTVHITDAVLGPGLFVDGPGVLATIRFEAIGLGSSAIHFAYSSLRDTTLQMPGIPHSTSDGSVAVVEDQTAPLVTLTSPDGGENWACGSAHDITWDQSDNVGIASDTIYYSTDGGSSWMFVWGGSPSTVYSWTVPHTPSHLCRVKIIAVDGSDNLNSDISEADFTISDETAPAVTLTSPDGGEDWACGSAHDITWDQGDNVAVVSDSIYYSTDGGSSWIPVWGGAATTSYSWAVPPTPSVICRAKVVAFDEADNRTEDISDDNFIISDLTAPTVTVNSPNGGEQWAPASVHDIEWTQSDNVSVASDTIYYSIDGGSSWVLVWGGPVATAYSWTVPGTLSDTCKVKVIAVDGSGNLNEDISDGYFAIGAVFACGDCNGDGTISFADALYLRNYYYQTPPGSPAPIGEGDVNLDGVITFADALYIKNYYYQTPPGSPPPCEPSVTTSFNENHSDANLFSAGEVSHE